MNKYIHLLSGNIVTAQRFDAFNLKTNPEVVKISAFHFVKTPKGNEPISPGDWIVKFDDYQVITDDELFSKQFRPIQDSDELQSLMRSQSEQILDRSSFDKSSNFVRIDQLNSRIRHLANNLAMNSSDILVIEELVDRISEYTDLIKKV